MNDNTRNGANVVPARRPLSRRGFIQLSGGVLAAGAGASALAACSSGSSASGAAAGASSAAAGAGKSGKTQLTLMSWEQFETGEKAAWFKVINDFEAANPNISVTWTGWPFATYDQNVITQAEAGGINADLVMCPPELASALISKFGMAVPLQSITDDLKLTPIPAHEQFMNGSNLEGLGVIDVPFAIDYDQRLLKQAGFDAPPTTLDEWL
jgi:multiple sugar transport system substrate-binding protein